jgi:hypothetical protein
VDEPGLHLGVLMDERRIYYVAHGLGAAVRGAAILKALGTGTLITPYRRIAELEGVAWFGGLLGNGHVYIWDRPGRIPARPGLQVSIGLERPEMDLSLDLDVPVVARSLAELDKGRAEAWWNEPLVINSRGRGYVLPPAEQRVLALGGQSAPGARSPAYGAGFYWPAMELMTTADDVLGGQQSVAEWLVVQGKLPDDGAARAAERIRELLGA